MTPLDILSTIRQAGGRVVVLDGDLQVVAPPGLLSPQDKQVLAENKAALVGILPDAERDAIQEVERLPQAEAEAVVEAARREWSEIVGGDQQVEEVVRAEIVGDELRLHCPTPEIASAIEAGRDRLERLLVDMQAEEPEEYQIVACPPPCPQCDSLRLWEGIDGRWYCLACHPPMEPRAALATSEAT